MTLVPKSKEAIKTTKSSFKVALFIAKLRQATGLPKVLQNRRTVYEMVFQDNAECDIGTDPF